MIVDLLHNKIVKDTATDAFKRSVDNVLVPLLSDRYGDSIERITMYEDYLADDFLLDGEWYYPLTVTRLGEGSGTVWIKWTVNKKQFKGGIPYAYTGDADLEFSLAGFVPQTFADKLSGRSIDYNRTDIALKVDAPIDNPLLLVGKYSQTFVDEMACQITVALCRALGVEGFTGCTMELNLLFAPGTYFEHTSENVTYRRLILNDKGCQGRDFWVKWTRLDGALGYHVSDTVSSENILFELGEDVSQKIREKEYRFLCTANPDKYQSAMGKKTVTEWRDLTKRAIKRGDLVRTATEPEFVSHVSDVSDKLKSLLDSYGVSTAPAAEPEVQDDSYDIVAELARSVLGDNASDADDIDIDVHDDIDTFAAETDDVQEQTDTVDPEQTDELSVPDSFSFDIGGDDGDDAELGTQYADESDISYDEYVDSVEIAEPAAEPATVDEDAIRREIEAKLRLEYETEARLRAEREAERLRLEHEKLLEENERLARLAKEAEEMRRIEEKNRRLEEERRKAEEEAERLAELERARLEEEKRREEARIRAEIEAKMRSEAKERERIAEAARLAVEEQKRLEAERAEREARERQEAYMREAERLRREEEARRLEDQRRLEELRRLEEEARRRREEEEAKARTQIVTKQAKLMFRYSVDLNVIKRIKSVVEETLVTHNKQKLNIHIRAYPLDANSIALEIKLPQNETNLLVSMMKALGGASLGITKITLE